jgi:outer membrane protein OmpA-like peptidoglycan-associated protein
MVRNMHIRLLIFVLLCAVAAAPVFAQPSTAKKYPDGHGGFVEFPLGDVSFADEAVSLELGKPRAAEANSQPQASLGIPDYKDTDDDTYVTLSCGGTLTLRFSDNALVDVAGPDLYVFEIGPAVEATNLAISADGQNWIEVGAISGGRADMDITSHIEPGAVFHYVRLTDLEGGCSGQWPGADIDAVGAIGAAMQFSLSGAVLFDTGKWELKPAAEGELNRLAGQLAAYSKGKVLIEGHTDNVGSGDANQALSENRAGAVLEYLQGRSELSTFSFTAKGYGESRPTAPNATDEDRARNRRVDMVLVPGA